MSSAGVWNGSRGSGCEETAGASGSSAVDPLLMVNDKERGTDLRFRRLCSILDGEPSEALDTLGDSGDGGAFTERPLAIKFAVRKASERQRRNKSGRASTSNA